MSPPIAPTRSWPVRLAVVLICSALAVASARPGVSEGDLEELAEPFHFTSFRMVPPPTPEGEGVAYAINPSAAHYKTYLHTLGAGVALGDLDGDGLANDACYTDIRSKAQIIAPLPGTGARFEPFELPLDLPGGRAQAWPAACRFADMNEDGLMDVYVSFLGTPSQLFLRREPATDGDSSDEPDSIGGPQSLGTESFAPLTLEYSGPPNWYAPSTTFTDVDGDGHQDIVVGLYFGESVGLFDAASTEPVEMNNSFSRARNGGENRLFLWKSATSGPEPTVVYEEQEAPFPGEHARGWTLAVGAGDINNDGLSDLYISNDFGPDTLLLNHSTPGQVRLIELKGDGGFNVPESMRLGDDSFKGMGIDFADVNDDGYLDMFVSNIASPFALGEVHFLWESTGDMEALEAGIAPYEDKSEDRGVSLSSWGWDSRMDDFNNDGVLELVQATGFLKGTVNLYDNFAQLGTINDGLVTDPRSWPAVPPDANTDGWKPNPFYVRMDSGRYADVSPLLFPGVLPNSRAIATADADGDGDLDMAWGNHWEDSTFYRNDAPMAGDFLGLHLLLPIAGEETAELEIHPGHPQWREGTPAIGAMVTVTLPDGRRLIRQVDGGNGHTGQRSADLHFGLGDMAPGSTLSLDLRWRDRQALVHEESLSLTPGWHTIVLASGPREE